VRYSSLGLEGKRLVLQYQKKQTLHSFAAFHRRVRNEVRAPTAKQELIDLSYSEENEREEEGERLAKRYGTEQGNKGRAE